MAENPSRETEGSGRKSKTNADEARAPREQGAAGRAGAGKEAASAINQGDTAEGAAIPVIGIGASAGGIEALSQFFNAMPADCGCAFVVVLHLDPKRESELAHVLSAHTTMPVLQAEDGMRIAPNHVYVIAPNSDLKVGGGGLHVSRPIAPRGHGHPVDVLFISLAIDQRERAIAIALSGTGSDGTDGLKAIRAQDGFSLVQSPETAKFDGMPRSAISAGMADHILAPGGMPTALLEYIRHGYVAAPAEIEATSPDDQATFSDVLDLLLARKHDFSGYKPSTLGRRVHRRLGLRNIETLEAYIDDLRTNPDEVTALVDDLLISVTGFFRDPEAWKALSDLVVAPWVAERETGASIRVWAPACSTGEEAYSLAMLVTERAEAAGKRFKLKVFATDAQEGNLRKARAGIYPAAAMAGFPPDRLQRFFQKLDGSFQVNKELREMIVFASHDLLRDPPYSRLDLVTCRNVLIYLEPDSQQKIIALCHFALRRGGHLFLGTAETIGQHEDLFEEVCKKWQIYRRTGPTRHDLMVYSSPSGRAESRRMEKTVRSSPEPDAATNDEPKASNEEVTSMNEELQSVNEELATSQEELQSLNEELNTTNRQLLHKIGELETVTSDLNNLLAGTETATLFLDKQFRIRWFAPATRDLFHLVTSDVGRPITDFALKFADEHLLRDAETVLNELSTIDTDVLSDTGRWYVRRIQPYRTQDNRIAGVVLTFSDITDRKRAEEHREILVGELNHRLKNLMATVQAVASQTLNSAMSVDDARQAFESRLIALGKAHDLLTKQHWVGADLRDLVSATVEPHSSDSNRFRIEGPHVRLVPAPALAIAMALHELATNATKYGSLSTPDGRVDIAWQLGGDEGDRRLSFRWTEIGGPPVAPPIRKGFGSRMIQRVLAAELGGEVRVAYDPSGVICLIDAPLPEGQ